MNRATFYDAIRSLFGGTIRQSQIDGCEALLAATDGLLITHRAYLFATALHETASTMQPVRETLAKTDESAVNRLESAWKAGKLGQVKTPYWRFDTQGKTWLGRGYVQLTHRDNYQKAAALTGVDLLGDPNKAMQPTVAAKILVDGCIIGIFTGKKLSDYLPGDYKGARRVVNGQDKAAAIAGYAVAFEAALRAAGASEAVSTPKPAPKPSPGKKPGVAGPLVAGGVVAAGAAWAWACKIPFLAWLFSSCGG